MSRTQSSSVVCTGYEFDVGLPNGAMAAATLKITSECTDGVILQTFEGWCNENCSVCGIPTPLVIDGATIDTNSDGIPDHMIPALPNSYRRASPTYWGNTCQEYQTRDGDVGTWRPGSDMWGTPATTSGDWDAVGAMFSVCAPLPPPLPSPPTPRPTYACTIAGTICDALGVNICGEYVGYVATSSNADSRLVRSNGATPMYLATNRIPQVRDCL